jgi:hypothetical protein
MMQAIKLSIPPSEFISFHLRSVDESAYNTAIKYVTVKNSNTWTIVVNYVSEGAFFKLEERLKPPYWLITSFTTKTNALLKS